MKRIRLSGAKEYTQNITCAHCEAAIVKHLEATMPIFFEHDGYAYCPVCADKAEKIIASSKIEIG